MLVNAAAGFGVPLVVGVWSDRLRARGTGRTRPFVWGGALVTAGGLAATALGASSSYLVLALTGAVVYIGLNALTTAHRALVPELFSPEARAKATSAQELALLGGGLVGLAVGGALTAISLWAPFAARRRPRAAARAADGEARHARRRRATSSEREPRSARLLPLDRAPARRPLLPPRPVALGAGLCRAADLLRALRRARAGPECRHGFRAAGRVRVGTGAATLAAPDASSTPRRSSSMLLLGVLALGGGLIAVSLSTSLVSVGARPAGGGDRLRARLHGRLPALHALIPEGESGGYTALYFSVRAIAAASRSPPPAGPSQATGTYRALFVARRDRYARRARPAPRRPAPPLARPPRGSPRSLLATDPAARPRRRAHRPARLDERALRGRSTASAPAPSGCGRRSTRTRATTSS